MSKGYRYAQMIIHLLYFLMNPSLFLLSRTWSDREIRTIMSQLYRLPLLKESVSHFEGMLTKCIVGLPTQTQPPIERYIDSALVGFQGLGRSVINIQRYFKYE